MGRMMLVFFFCSSPLMGQGRESFEQVVVPFVNRYCVACHNNKSNSGGLDLMAYTSTRQFQEGRETWRRILKRINAGDMPPRRLPRPPAEELREVTSWLEAEFGQ